MTMPRRKLRKDSGNQAKNSDLISELNAKTNSNGYLISKLTTDEKKSRQTQ